MTPLTLASYWLAAKQRSQSNQTEKHAVPACQKCSFFLSQTSAGVVFSSNFWFHSIIPRGTFRRHWPPFFDYLFIYFLSLSFLPVIFDYGERWGWRWWRDKVGAAGAEKLDPRVVSIVNLHRPCDNLIATDQFRVQRREIQTIQGAVFVCLV